MPAQKLDAAPPTHRPSRVHCPQFDYLGTGHMSKASFRDLRRILFGARTLAPAAHKLEAAALLETQGAPASPFH